MLNDCYRMLSLLISKCMNAKSNYIPSCYSCKILTRCRVLYIRETHLTPAEKLTTGKNKPSTLKSSNMPWTGWPLILKDMLEAPRSRQQLTTSSEFSKCWLIEATARGIRPIRRGENNNFVDFCEHHCQSRVSEIIQIKSCSYMQFVIMSY